MSKVVLITGGSSGIGKSIGEYLIQKGMTVYGTSRNPQNYSESKFPIIALDITKTETISSCIQTVIAAEGHIDVVINNAGAGITGPIEEIPEIEIKRNFETTFFGPLNVIKEVLPLMRKQNSGLIINITSIAGYMGLPYRGIYCAGKGALELLTETLRIEIKDFNIQMTTIAPGDFATNIVAGRYHAPFKENSPYSQNYERVLKAINEDVNKGNDPIDVAKMVYKVIETKHPKVHYKVGVFMQRFSIFLKRILPSKYYERLLLNYYEL